MGPVLGNFAFPRYFDTAPSSNHGNRVLVYLFLQWTADDANHPSHSQSVFHAGVVDSEQRYGFASFRSVNSVLYLPSKQSFHGH